jgi:hypothetical protein
MDTTYRQIAAHTYEVCTQETTGVLTTWRLLGTVQRFGSLPSMQSWRARPYGGSWGPPRRTRNKARNDLIGES